MKCYTSKWKLVGLLLLTFVMVGISYYCTTFSGPAPRMAGWIGVAFFGLGFVAFPVMMFRSGPQVITGDEGIEDRRLKVGVIRWKDIHSLSIGSVHSTKFLCIKLNNPQEYLDQMPVWKRLLAKVNKAMGFDDLLVSFSGLTPGIDEAWQFLKKSSFSRKMLW